MKKKAKAIASPTVEIPACPKCLKQVPLLEDGLCAVCSEEAAKATVAYKEQCNTLMGYVEQLFSDLLRGSWDAIDHIRHNEEGKKMTVQFAMTFKGFSTLEADVNLTYAERHKLARSVFVEDPRQAELPTQDEETPVAPVKELKLIGMEGETK